MYFFEAWIWIVLWLGIVGAQGNVKSVSKELPEFSLFSQNGSVTTTSVRGQVRMSTTSSSTTSPEPSKAAEIQIAQPGGLVDSTRSETGQRQNVTSTSSSRTTQRVPGASDGPVRQTQEIQPVPPTNTPAISSSSSTSTSLVPVIIPPTPSPVSIPTNTPPLSRTIRTSLVPSKSTSTTSSIPFFTLPSITIQTFTNSDTTILRTSTAVKPTLTTHFFTNPSTTLFQIETVPSKPSASTQSTSSSITSRPPIQGNVTLPPPPPRPATTASLPPSPILNTTTTTPSPTLLPTTSTTSPILVPSPSLNLTLITTITFVLPTQSSTLSIVPTTGPPLSSTTTNDFQSTFVLSGITLIPAATGVPGGNSSATPNLAGRTVDGGMKNGMKFWVGCVVGIWIMMM